MRIAFISREMYPYYYGGIGVQIWLMMKECLSQGHAVSFFTEEPADLPADWKATSYPEIDVQFVSMIPQSSTVHRSLGYAMSVAAAVRERQQVTPFDLLVVTDFNAESFSLQFEPVLGVHGTRIPILMTLHGPSFEVLHHDQKELDHNTKIICLLEDAAIAASSMCISPSLALWNSVAQRLPLQRTQHRIIPNLYNDRIFKGPVPAPSVGEPIRIFSVGRLQKLKGPDRALRVFFELCKAGHDSVELHFIGRDLHWQELEGSFTEYWKEHLPAELAPRVVFHGQRSPEQVVELLKGAFCTLFLSSWESFGIAALESMALGVPAIVTAGTGLAEIIGASHPLVVPQQGCEAAATKIIERLIAHRAEYETLRQSSLTRALELREDARCGIRDILTYVAPDRQRLVKAPADASPEGAARSIASMLAAIISQPLSDADARLDEISAQVEQLSELVSRFEEQILLRDSVVEARDAEIARRGAEILAAHARANAMEKDMEMLRSGLQQAHGSIASEVLERDSMIRDRDRIIADLLEVEIVRRDAMIRERDEIIQELHNAIDHRDALIVSRDTRINELDSIISEMHGKLRNQPEITVDQPPQMGQAVVSGSARPRTARMTRAGTE